MADVTFVFHGEWLEAIEMLPIDQQDKIIAEIVRHGAEKTLMHEQDGNVVSYVNLLRGRIDASKKDYAKKVENGKSNGRKKTVDSKEVWRLAQKGMNAEGIAAELGVSKDTVYHDVGWKSRKDTFWGLG